MIIFTTRGYMEEDLLEKNSNALLNTEDDVSNLLVR